MSEVEEWRAIPGYEQTYEASSLGRIKSLPRNTTRGGLRSVTIGKRGYPVVGLTQDGVQKTHEVHRLVALAFLGARPDGMEVRHADGNRRNAAAANLAYGTRSENVSDKRAHGTDHNVSKTHCPRGHEYTTENARISPARPGARYCRACNDEYARSWRLRANSATQAKASRAREPWSDYESRVAMDSTLTATQAAETIGRSMSAVLRQRARLRKLQGGPDFDSRWVP